MTMEHTTEEGFYGKSFEEVSANIKKLHSGMEHTTDWETQMDSIHWEEEIPAKSYEQIKDFIREILSEERAALRKGIEGMIGTKYEYDEGNIHEMPIRNEAIRDVLALLDKDTD